MPSATSCRIPRDHEYLAKLPYFLYTYSTHLQQKPKSATTTTTIHPVSTDALLLKESLSSLARDTTDMAVPATRTPIFGEAEAVIFFAKLDILVRHLTLVYWILGHLPNSSPVPTTRSKLMPRALPEQSTSHPPTLHSRRRSHTQVPR